MGGKNDDSVHFDQHFNIFYIISVQGKFSICKTLMCTLFEGWGGEGGLIMCMFFLYSFKCWQLSTSRMFTGS